MGQVTQPQPVIEQPVVSQPNSFVSFFSGKKTYVVSGAMIIYAVLGVYLKDMQPVDAGMLILQALGLVGLRLGIAKQGS